MRIISFTMDYWDEFTRFMNKHWAQNHPIVNKNLFTWQYTGFGPNKGIGNSKILIVDGKISGFRGVIPGVYQYKKNGELTLKAGGSLAMWMVHPDLRGKGYGSKLLEETEKNIKVLVSAGINVNTAVPIYLKNDYNYLEKLNRYVIPIEAEGYTSLIEEKEKYKSVKQWVKEINIDTDQSEKPKKVESKKLENLWKKSTVDIDFFGLYRSEEFWEWRYKESPYFKYLFFGDVDYNGLIIARIEKVTDSADNIINNQKVLRIIEIIPYDKKVWNGINLEKTTKLVEGVISWAKIEGCCAADFQISNSRLEPLMKSIGFKLESDNNKLTNLAGLISPLRQSVSPINALWKIRELEKEAYSDSENTYIVKSDNDMDRPILIK